MAKGKRGKGRSKGKRGKRGRKGAAKNQIPLEVLQRRLGKLSTIVAKRGGKLPKYY